MLKQRKIMPLGNKLMYDKARHEDELEFIKVLLKNGFINAIQGSKQQDFRHIDVVGTFKNGIEYYFDVKDLSERNLNSSNYSISERLVLDFKRNPEKFSKHFIAFREYKNGMPTGFYNIFYTETVVENVFQMTNNLGKKYYLFNVKRGLTKFPHRTFGL